MDCGKPGSYRRVPLYHLCLKYVDLQARDQSDLEAPPRESLGVGGRLCSSARC
jgi:hypothetical protein